MTDFRDRNVLITGGASGIGLLMARRIGARGGRLALWDLDAEALEGARSELEGRGFPVATWRCDITDREAVRDAAAAVLEQQGPIDVLINNAGVVSGRLLLEATDEQIQRTLDVNLAALFWVTRAFLPQMVERNQGHIVTIASAAGLSGVSKLTDYCASKFGAFGFDESLRQELALRDLSIRTTVVCPYYVATEMFRGVRSRLPWLLPILDPERVADRIVRAIERDRARLILPWILYTVWPMRLLPVRWFDVLLGLLGVNRSMDEFTGHGGRL